MDAGFGVSTGRQPQDVQSSNSITNDAGSFECNICFDIAQDPIVTLCGHLFCWPCLYKWLHAHAHSQECPVCKAVIEEEKLIPLYGRGSASSDSRSTSVLGMDIPPRPTGSALRPDTSPSRDHHSLHHHDHYHHRHRHQFQPPGFGFMGGFPPMAAPRRGNLSVSAGMGGLFPSLFNFQLHGFPEAAAYGPGGGFPNGIHGRRFHHGFPHQHVRGHQRDSCLTLLFIIVGVLLVLAFMGS